MEATSSGDPVSWCSVGFFRIRSLFSDRLNVMLVRRLLRGCSLGAASGEDEVLAHTQTLAAGQRSLVARPDSVGGFFLDKARVFWGAPVQSMLRTEAECSKLESEFGLAGLYAHEVLGRWSRLGLVKIQCIVFSQ